VRSGTCDVSDKESVDRAVAEAVDWMGGVDILVNAAAIFPANSAESIPQDEWDRVFAVNVRGTVLTNQAVFAHMKAKGGQDTELRFDCRIGRDERRGELCQ
jgi:NAD(P)-dependent dehydrogenase (short-subunit alcohol dehydrogenase family)